MMKLILLSALIALAATQALAQKCCPCTGEGPGPDQPGTNLIEFVVQEPDTSKGNPNPVIYDLINKLINSGVIEPTTATKLLITFGVPVPNNLPSQGTPVTPDTVNNLPINGKPDVKDKVIQILTPLLNRPTVPGLIKVLLTLVLNNRVTPLPEIFQINIDNGVVPNVQIVVPDDKKPTQPVTARPVDQGGQGPVVTRPVDQGGQGPDQGGQEPVTRPSDLGGFTRPDVQINPGKPSDNTVTVNQVLSPNDAKNLIIYLLKVFLVPNNVLDRPTAESFTITFFPDYPDAAGARPLNPGEPIKVGGNPKPRDKFTTAITPLLNNPTAPGTVNKLIRPVVELVLDNGIVDLQTIVKIVVKFGVGVQVQQRPVDDGTDGTPSQQEPVFPDDKLNPGQPSDSTVEIPQVVRPENLPSLINRLLQILVNKRIIDVPTANRILVTFRIPGKPGSPFNPDQATPLSPGEGVPAGGNPKPKDKFVNAIINLVRNPQGPQGQGPAPSLVKILIEFLIDNGIIDLPTATQLAVTFGISIRVQSRPDGPDGPDGPGGQDGPVQEPQLNPGNRPNGMDIKSTVTITQVTRDLKPLIKRLVELTVQGGVIPQSTAPRLLVTFNIPSGGSPITNPSQLNVGGNPPAGQKFTTALTPLLANPSSPNSLSILVKILSELLIDNAVVDQNTIVKFLVAYGVGSQINIQFVPNQEQGNVQEPPLDKGQPPAGMQIDSTISITQILKDVKPLIKRLVELNVQAGIIPQSSAPRLLITFGVPGGSGSPISSPSQLNVGGNPTASQKFTTALTPLLGNPSSQSSLSILVKILSELLVDNAAVSHNSIIKFLVAYGVGSQINVQYRPSGSGGQGGSNNVQEPQLVRGNPPAGMQIDSTVQITQVIGDLKPLAKRLIELNVQSGVIPQAVAASLLATFGIQAGGSPLTSAANLKLGGNAAASAKFIKNLNPLLFSASSSSSLKTFVKILTELLVDNNTADMNSAMKFLVAYGVGAQINVRYTPVSQGGVGVNVGGNLGLGGLGNLNFGGGFNVDGNTGYNVPTNVIRPGGGGFQQFLG